MADLVFKFLEATRDPRIVPLGAASPGPDLLPVRRLDHMMASIARRAGTSTHAYDFSAGNLELRRHIARRSMDWGCSLSADDIITTNSLTEALSLCLRAVAEPGDIVAVESPTHFGILQLLEVMKMKALEIPTHPRHGMNLEALAQGIKKHPVKACVMMTNCHNPLGGCMSDDSKRDLADLLASHRIALLENDISGDLFFGPYRPKTAKANDREGLVLLCSSFVKTLSPGFQVGWSAPGRFKDKVERLKVMTTGPVPSLLQLVIAEFLQHGGYDHHLRRIRKAYATQVQLMSRAISEYFPKGTRVTRPAGGFVLWIELPRSVDSLQLYAMALQENITIAPGPVFSASQSYKNFIRLNCSYPWSNQIESAVIKLGQLSARRIP